MSGAEDAKFLKIQSCVLRVNIHCDGCKQKVRRLLHKVDGVYTASVDAERGEVTVCGNVEPETLIRKLARKGKHAELVSPKPAGNAKPQQQQLGSQLQKLQLDKGSKPQKAAAAAATGTQQKGQQKPPEPARDAKLAPKSVKFDVPDDDGSEFDDEDDLDFDDADEFDDGFEEEDYPAPTKPPKPNADAEKKPPGNVSAPARKSGPAESGGAKGGTQAPAAGVLPRPGNVQDCKNVHGSEFIAGGGIRPAMAAPGSLGPLPVPVAQMGNFQRPPAGYFHGGPATGAPAPGANAAYHQQQYLAALMQQQQQQRMMMMMNGHQPMAYARPPVPLSYMPPAPPPEYAHFFSDENATGSCSVM